MATNSFIDTSKVYPTYPHYYATNLKAPIVWEKDQNEMTGMQGMMIPITYDGVICPWEHRINFPLHRRLIKDPTISITRSLMIAPMTLSEWSVIARDGAPEGAKELVEEEINSRREEIIEQALRGVIDFGWVAFETVFEDGKNLATGKHVKKLKKLKQLIHYFTWLRANPLDGSFAGIMQDNIATGQRIYLDADQVLLFNIEQEGSNWYGNSRLDNCIDALNGWNTVKDISLGYLRKIAGAHWVIYYPVGTTMYNGIMTDNQQIAQDIVRQLEANGSMTIPGSIKNFIDSQLSQNEGELRIENLTDSGSSSASYLDQMRYYDILKMRGLNMPERALTEGTHGTNAEAVSHLGAAVSGMESMGRSLVRQLNAQLVNRLLALNYGDSAKGTVYIEAARISDSHVSYIQDILRQLIGNPDYGYVVSQNIDVPATMEMSGIPMLPKGDASEETIRDHIEEIKEQQNEDRQTMQQGEEEQNGSTEE